MLLTIVGLALSTIAASIAIHFSAISKKWGKPLLIMLTIVGFFIALLSAKREEDLKIEERTKAENAITKLRVIETKTDFIELAVGDLAALKKLSGDTKFYVRIGASDKPNAPDGLRDTLERIKREFRGNTSDMVEIRKPKLGSKNYELVFGKNLTLPAAEVYHRLAIAHGLAKGLPQIFPEQEESLK